MNTNQIAAMGPGQVLRDNVVTGLTVRAFPGRKSYYLYYRTKAKVERRPKLGDHGIITLAQARELAKAELAKVAAGRDPVAERRQEAGEPTVTEFFGLAYKTHWAQTKAAKEVRRLFVHHIAPRLGNLRVRAVRLDDVQRLHGLLTATPYQANRVLAVVSKLLNLAERHGLRDLHSNPCRHIRRCPELSRKRFANRSEFTALGPVLAREAENPANLPSVAHILLVLLAGARPSEIAAARWDWLEERVDDAGRRYGVLRLPDGKTGSRDIYLPAQALALLDRLPRTAGTITGIKSPVRLWHKIRAEAGCPDLRLYDLRRTFATVGMATTKNRGVVGELLGHRTAQTTLVYARLWDEAAHEAVALTGQAIAALLGPSTP